MNINELNKDKEAPTVEEVPVEAPTKETINGKEYKIVLLDSYDGMDCWEYILKRILPSVGTAADAMQHDTLIDGSPTTFAEAMMHLSSKLDGSTFSTLSKVLLEGATVDGKPIDVNQEFKGNYGTWRKVLMLALKGNFSSFFDKGWGENLTSLMTMVAPQFKSSQSGSEQP